uniref:CUB domain-containing protein n=1 Tax=Daphnia magna TaxID=35525 RepID=A0A0P6DD37_9CRUS
MAKLGLFLLIVALSNQTSLACNDNKAEQLPGTRRELNDYWVDSYGFPPPSLTPLYYHEASPPEAAISYQGRSSLNQPNHNAKPFKNYFINKNADGKASGRFALGGLRASLINTGLFNNRFTPANTFRPLQGLGNKTPVTLNPNFDNLLTTFDGCTAPNGESGICAPGNICSLFGGRPSGSCILGKVCCINVVPSCGGTASLNNTHWQSPAVLSAPSTCTLTVKLDATFVEQKKPICQLRLDFISFTTSQPTAGTCTDTFQISGSTNTAPIICGDNNGQHMYLDVPSSLNGPTNVRLMFNFAAGTGNSPRTWNIKIAMLPCGANYLAPRDCLQYFTSATGIIRSFNWRDIAGVATRQLNNQNYNICFRTQEIDGQIANRICLTPCTITNGGDAFSITSVPGNLANSAVGTTGPNPLPPPVATVAVCLYDFLLIAQGTNPINGLVADRFCGNQLNPIPAGAAVSVTVCTQIRPFKLTYQTDNTEGAVFANNQGIIIPAFGDAGNVGFCLDFQQRIN